MVLHYIKSMNVYKKTMFLFFLLIILCFSVFAIQTISISNTNLNIEIPEFETYKYGTDIQMHFHVYNSSGFLVTNSTTCTFHLYNSSEEHILISDLLFDTTNKEFEIQLGSGNFTNIGYYAYIIQCNNTKEANFVMTSFKLTKTGLNTSEEPKNHIWFLIILVIILDLVFAFAYIKLSNEHEFFKWLLFGIICLSPLFLFSIISNFINSFSFIYYPLENSFFYVFFELLLYLSGMYVIFMFLKYLFFGIIKKKGKK